MHIRSCPIYPWKRVDFTRSDYKEFHFLLWRIIRHGGYMESTITIQLMWLGSDIDKNVSMPCYMTSNSAGLDVCAAIDENLVLKPGDIKAVATGFAMAVPPGFEVQIRPRSGLALKYGISLINSPGTIDADYRGEVKVLLINHGKADFTVKRGDRIAQMVIKKVCKANLTVVEKLDITDRGDGGFGHTGI